METIRNNHVHAHRIGHMGLHTKTHTHTHIADNWKNTCTYRENLEHCIVDEDAIKTMK